MTSHVYPLKCRIRAAGGVTRVDVYDDIGAGGWMSDGVSAADFAAQLAPVKGALEVHINSAGGDVFDGIAISSAIRAHKGRVTTVVDGLAASIASVIAQAGQERVVQPGGMLMIHDAFGLCVGDAAEMTAMASTLDKVSDNIASVYAGRSGRTQDYWRSQMRGETWYTADEAVSAGLADKVGDGDAALPAGLDLAALGSVPGRIAARLRMLPQAAADDSPAACPTCDGNKTVRSGGGKFQQCPDCSGTGRAQPPDTGDEPDGADEMQDAADAPGDDMKDCPTCDGSGKILEGHRECPDCHGSGKVPEGAQDRARRQLARYGRVLGAESMPIRNEAIPVHHTATVDTPWDGPAAVAAMPSDDAVLRYCHAWESPAAAAVTPKPDDDDADDQKQNYKFPHHTSKGGPANLAACRNGLARLSSANIPPGDDAGVEAHLNAHLKDGGGHPSEDHAQPGLSGLTPEQIRAALKGATE